jgi:hypothetical protein
LFTQQPISLWTWEQDVGTWPPPELLELLLELLLEEELLELLLDELLDDELDDEPLLELLLPPSSSPPLLLLLELVLLPPSSWLKTLPLLPDVLLLPVPLLLLTPLLLPVPLASSLVGFVPLPPSVDVSPEPVSPSTPVAQAAATRAPARRLKATATRTERTIINSSAIPIGTGPHLFPAVPAIETRETPSPYDSTGNLKPHGK